MPRNDLAKLVVRLEAESTKLQQGLDQANTRLRRFERQADGVGKAIKRTFAGAFAGLTVAAGVAAIKGIVTTYADAADQIQKLSIRLGASTEALSEFRHVADLSGVSFNTLTMGLQRMTRRVSEAAQGTGEAKNALAELGLDATVLAQLAPEDQFEAVADALSEIAVQGDRTRLAMKLFDSEGVALLQTMEGGAAAIREAREEARALGLSISQDQANQAAAFNDAWTRLSATFQGAAQQIAIELVPTLTELADNLREDVAPAIREVLEFFDLIEPKADKMRQVEREIEAVARGIEATQKALSFQEGQGNTQAVESLTTSLKAQEDQLDRLQAKLDRYNGVTPAAGPAVAQVPGLRIPPVLSPPGSSGRGGKSDAEREAERFAQSLRSLVDQLDPVSAKTRDYLENVTLLDRAWADGQISGERHAELIRLLAVDTEALRESEAALTADRQKAVDLIKDLDPGAVFRDQIVEVQRLRDAFPELSDTLAEVELDLQDKWDAIGDGAEDAAEQAKDAWSGFGDIAASAFEDAILEGEKLSDVVNALADDITRLVLRNTVTGPLAGAVEKAIGGGFGNLFGFATGGSFTVGGSGGTDSQVVAFRATPGEEVTVRTPAQQQAGGTTVNHFHFVLPSDSVDHRRTGEQVAREAARYMRIAQAGV